MNIVSLLYRCINRFIRNTFIVTKYKKQNRKSDISIISSTCLGGVMYHDLGMKFLSPTINLAIHASDFIKFVENISYYLSLNLENVYYDEKYNYPIGELEDIKIYFVHYKSIEECIDKWNERKNRINFDNIYLVNTDQNGMTLELLERYLKLPYKKIIYVHKKELILSDECIYIPGFENEDSLGDITDWYKLTGYKYFDKFFNYVNWINKE